MNGGRPPPRQGANGRFLLCAAGLVAVAFLLRLHRIGAAELCLDEAFSFQDVTASGWVDALRFKDVPPLYPLLLRGWMALAGDSEAGLRLLSAVLGTLFVGVTIWAGREIFEPRVGLWSGLWAAVSPMHVYYSQEARPYALLTALLVATYVLNISLLSVHPVRRCTSCSAPIRPAARSSRYRETTHSFCNSCSSWAFGRTLSTAGSGSSRTAGPDVAAVPVRGPAADPASPRARRPHATRRVCR